MLIYPIVLVAGIINSLISILSSLPSGVTQSLYPYTLAFATFTSLETIGSLKVKAKVPYAYERKVNVEVAGSPR